MNYEIKLIQSLFIDCNCYLIKYKEKNIIVDPCVDVKTLKKYNVNKVDAIFITHGHVDHILFLSQIIKEYNCMVYLTGNCLTKVYDDSLNLSSMFNYPLNIEKYSFNYQIVHDNELILLDELEFKIIITPGHTNCSMCILLENDLFTGDTLFKNSVGRTDFPTGNSLELLKSLKKIVNFNCNFNIYPGHNDLSTINEELKNNYYLKF